MSSRQEEILVFLKDRFESVESAELAPDGTLSVGMCGKCADCPMRGLTMEADLAEALAEEFPEVKTVRIGEEISEESMNMVRSILRSPKC